MQGEAGTRLDQQVRERGALPPEQATQIAQEVLAQIDILAQRGEVRALSGISLSRILLSPNGQVVLLRSSDELPAVVSVPAYASPEEIRGDSPSVKSAIYSMGCALFELLTGRPPFLGKDPKAVLRAHLSSPAPDLTALRPDLPSALSLAVASFLAKDPARRPLDATHAIGVLRTALGGPAEEFDAPPPPIPGNAVPRRVPRPALPGNAAPGARAVPRISSGAAVRSPPIRSGAVPTRAGNSASPIRGRAPASLRPAIPAGSRARGGIAPGRGAAAPSRPGIRRAPAGPAPPASTWIFTWSGLGLGVVLSLFFIANELMKNQAPPPASSQLTKEERESIAGRRAEFKKAVAEEAELALREFRNVPARLSYAERAAMVKELLDRFNHTPAAREMAESFILLRTQAVEAAANPARQQDHSPASAPAPAPVEGQPAPGEGAKEISPVDGIELLPGKKDDGTTDL